jgi:sulfide:quinone oxidoreductase
MAGKTILILGGGVGGYTAAHELRARLSREHRIILIDRETEPPFAPSFLWLMTGGRAPDAIHKDLRVLAQQGVEFVHAEAQTLDIAARRVITNGGIFDYDYLIVALGAELAPELIPNLSDIAQTPYSLAGATQLRDALADFRGGRVVVVIASLPYKCPAAPYETALLLDSALKYRGIPHSVEIFTPEGLPLPVAGPDIGKAVKEILATRDIGFHPKVKLTAVNAASKELTFDDGTKTNFDFLVAVPPHRAPQVVRDGGLTDASGWIPVDKATLKTSIANVFALGDVAAIRLPGRYSPDTPLMLPKAGAFAHAQAQVAANNIAFEISGQGAPTTWDGFGSCFLEIGAGQAGFATGNFYAEPTPTVNLRTPSVWWHWGKVLFEKEWLAAGLSQRFLRAVMIVGARALGVEVKL